MPHKDQAYSHIQSPCSLLQAHDLSLSQMSQTCLLLISTVTTPRIWMPCLIGTVVMMVESATTHLRMKLRHGQKMMKLRRQKVSVNLRETSWRPIFEC